MVTTDVSATAKTAAHAAIIIKSTAKPPTAPTPSHTRALLQCDLSPAFGSQTRNQGCVT